MASSINASTSGSGGVITTADNSGVLNLQSSGTTVATISSSGFSTPSGSTINVANTFGFKNRIINGGMVIDQRNAGASVALSNVTTYIVDRFAVRTGTGSGNTAIQSSTAPAGFSKSMLVTIGTGASPSAGQVNYIYQAIEAYNLADLNWGTANAKTITLSFWVRSSVTGTFSGALRNDAADAAYPFTYTISTANTWTQASVTIVGPTIGTWPTNNTTGVIVFFDLGSSSAVQGTAGVWAAADYRAATGSTQLVVTSGATLYITGVQFEVGSQATSFDFRSIGQELALCQRYCFVPDLVNSFYTGGCNGTSSALATIPFPVVMRSAPTGTFSGTFSGDNFANGQTFTAANTSFNLTSVNTARLYLQSGSGSAFRQSDAFTTNTNSSTAKVIISAEL